jgi:hypothetical protein
VVLLKLDRKVQELVRTEQARAEASVATRLYIQQHAYTLTQTCICTYHERVV